MVQPLCRTPPGSVHFVGIGGIAIAGIAVELARCGWTVTGSDDATYGVAAGLLACAGIPVKQPCSPENLPPSADFVIAGGTHLWENAEIVAARERGFGILTFPEFLARWFPPSTRSTLVAGTNGKTSTTAMLLRLLHAAGRTPSYLIGGSAPDLDSTFRLASEQEAVIEADESRCARWLREPKFLRLPATNVVLTSLSPDHPETFAGPCAYFQAFRSLLARLPGEGWIVAHAEDLRRLEPWSSRAKVHRIGAGGHNLEVDGAGGHFLLDGESVELGVPGAHMARNAALALVAARLEGCAGADALAEFRGVRGRLQNVGGAPVPVYLDEGYHPEAIRANLAALSQAEPGRKWHVVLQPRYLSSGTMSFDGAWRAALAGAQHVHVFPEGITRGEKVPAEDAWRALDIVRELARAGIAATFQRDINPLLATLHADLRADHGVLFQLPAHHLFRIVEITTSAMRGFPDFSAPRSGD